MCSFASRGRLHYIGFLLLVLLIGSQSSRAQGPCVLGPAVCGQWTNVISLPIIPVAAALLPDGRVLGWSTNDSTTFEGDICTGTSPPFTCIPSQTLTSLITPQSGAPPALEKPHDMFCPGTAYLPNGQLLVNGGSSSPETTIYDPLSSTWSSDAEMNVRRGYNASVLLSNGSVFTIGGGWAGAPLADKIGELWAPGQPGQPGHWSKLVGISAQPITGPDPEDVNDGFVYRGDNHAWLFAVRDGRVFHAGPSAEMHWITTDGDGTIVSAGNRLDDPYSMNGNAVMYDIGLIFKTGGAPAYSGTNAVATTNTYVIDINAAIADPQNPVVVKKTAQQMTLARTYANAVVLPTGQILVVGGQPIGVTFTDTNAVLTPELWDPATNPPSFRELADMQTPRVYHSVALLLSDGRVFVGGGGQCGTCPTNHPNAEIFSPPYPSLSLRGGWHSGGAPSDH